MCIVPMERERADYKYLCRHRQTEKEIWSEEFPNLAYWEVIEIQPKDD